MKRATATSHSLVANFTSPAATREAPAPDWLRRWREASMARFEQVGFPTPRQEEWRNTNVDPITATEFAPAPPEALPAVTGLPRAVGLDIAGPRIVFIDGRYAPGLSSNLAGVQGAWIGNLGAALKVIPDELQHVLQRRDPSAVASFRALNGALLEDGAVVWVRDDVSLPQPVQVLYGSTGHGGATASHPRTLVVAGRGSRVEVVETFFGLDEGVYLTNAVTEVDVGDNASVGHYRIQFESPRAFHVGCFDARQGRDSRLAAHSIDLGGRLVRNDVAAVLDGEGADCLLNGLYLTRDEQHVDNQTVLDHARPHGSSREVYKGILDGRSRTVFNGRIVVRPGAQKTDAKQSNPNLLLSDGALAHTRPQLEIYADDVKCTHGATVGRLDEDAVFYLRSRAVDRAEARRLLIEAFAAEVLDRIGIDPLRTRLAREVSQRLSGAGRSRTV